MVKRLKEFIEKEKHGDYSQKILKGSALSNIKKEIRWERKSRQIEDSVLVGKIQGYEEMDKSIKKTLLECGQMARN